MAFLWGHTSTQSPSSTRRYLLVAELMPDSAPLSATALEGYHSLDKILLVVCDICHTPVPLAETEAHTAWHDRIEGIRAMTSEELCDRHQRITRWRQRASRGN